VLRARFIELHLARRACSQNRVLWFDSLFSENCSQSNCLVFLFVSCWIQGTLSFISGVYFWQSEDIGRSDMPAPKLTSAFLGLRFRIGAPLLSRKDCCKLRKGVTLAWKRVCGSGWFTPFFFSESQVVSLE